MQAALQGFAASTSSDNNSGNIEDEETQGIRGLSCLYFVLVTVHPLIFVFCFLGGEDTGEEASPTEGEGANEGASQGECGGSDCVRSKDEVKGNIIFIPVIFRYFWFGF